MKFKIVEEKTDEQKLWEVLHGKKASCEECENYFSYVQKADIGRCTIPRQHRLPGQSKFKIRSSKDTCPKWKWKEKEVGSQPVGAR